jgi:hypothetical protein
MIISSYKMICTVAKHNSAVKHRKHRDYPWNNIAEFLSDDLTVSSAVAIENVLQTRFKSLWRRTVPLNTTILNQVPNNGFHESYVLSLDQYLEKMESSEAMYEQTMYHQDAQNDWFFGTDTYNKYRQNCFVVKFDIPEYKIDFTFMLRPFIFPKQSQDLWHAGSLYVHTENNQRGWFYQMKYQIIE